jgi:hypothetical protein
MQIPPRVKNPVEDIHGFVLPKSAARRSGVPQNKRLNGCLVTVFDVQKGSGPVSPAYELNLLFSRALIAR